MGLDKGEEIMIIDRYTKAVFTLIAISLFVISLNPWIAPTNAYAELSGENWMMFRTQLSSIAYEISNIDCSR
jgi:hypothetical protein